jgi:ribosomal protein S27AE
VNTIIKWIYQLRGWSGFWQDKKTGRWYAYAPGYEKDYWSHEAERVPVPTWREFWACRSGEIEFAHQEAVEAGGAVARLLEEAGRLRELLVVNKVCPDCGGRNCMADGINGLYCNDCGASYLLRSGLDEEIL